MSIDMNRVGVLLHVISEGVQHGAAYRDIISEANVELQWMNGVAKQDGLDRAKAEAEAKVVPEPTPHGDQSPEDHPPAPPSGDGEPGPDATMTTAVERRV